VNAQAQTRTPIPIEAMARYPFLSQVQLSPDGRHLAALTSLDGQERSISIWNTDALNANPVRFGVSGAAARNRVQFAEIDWVANDRLLVIMIQPVNLAPGPEGRFYTGIARIVNLDGSQWIEPMAQSARTEVAEYVEKFLTVSLLDQLPRDPEYILMSRQTLDATYVYRVNVRTGAGERVAQLAENEGVALVDREGRIRVKQFARFRDGDWVIGHEIFDTQTNAWEEHPLLGFAARERRNINVQAFDPADPDLLIVIDDQGQNFTYARGYSISRRAFTETLFQDPRHDIANVIIDRANQDPTRIVGFRYWADIERPYLADATHRALYDGVQAQLRGLDIEIGSANGGKRVVVAESSRQPPAYFLLDENRRLFPLGASLRDIPSARLAPTELVHYAARDGLQIPAFLTLPFGWRRGDPPLPVIIQPHGGPWSRNDASWGGGDLQVTQFFASRGFAVLQPQFRGSTGFGARLWRAGDGEWGQKMQDDKDDGLAWLVREGVADPRRALIYGFSYGGFAAAAATVRPNSPYRCAISGGGVSSLQRLGSLWRQNRITRQYQGVTVRGMDPLERAADASIPILLYHGDRDQTAPIWHSQRFAGALQGAGKPHQFVVIEDMPHGALTPAMQRRELELVEAYIRGPCGITY
jgi:dipeptidyl aminopeptidase/acylaminoacyl peptidase